MFEQKFDLLTLCMLFGLALGLIGYLATGQVLSIGLGLGFGYLVGLGLDRLAGASPNMVEDWPVPNAGR